MYLSGKYAVYCMKFESRVISFPTTLLYRWLHAVCLSPSVSLVVNTLGMFRLRLQHLRRVMHPSLPACRMPDVVPSVFYRKVINMLLEKLPEIVAEAEDEEGDGSTRDVAGAAGMEGGSFSQVR